MRLRRFISPSAERRPALYHCVSRVVDRDFKLGSREKEVFVRMMREYEAFCGVRVLSFCIMSNHFHVLVEVPPKKAGSAVPMGDEEFLTKVRGLYSGVYYFEIEELLERLRKSGADRAAEELKAKYTRRMYDLSEFMKGVKQRFTQWYNRKLNRAGTMWEGRFKSVLVEDGYAARVMSAYINLNPVRAGIVKRPEDYRWSSYGEAMSLKRSPSRKLAREGLCRVMQIHQETGGRISAEKSEVVWEKEGGSWYRMMLFADGEEVFVAKPESGMDAVRVRKGFKREEVEEVLARKGKLSVGEMLRCKVRYLNDGMVLGTKGFVDGVFKKARERFGVKRKSGARPMKEVSWKEKEQAMHLYSMRALKKEVLK